MSAWRKKAAELLPELAEELSKSESPMVFWIEAEVAFSMAYNKRPINRDFIKRVYEFADWSSLHGEESQDASQDLGTCVAVCFYEHLPTDPIVRADIPQWLTRNDVVDMMELFTYLASEAEYQELLGIYDGKIKEPPYRKPRKGKPRHIR